MDKRISIIDKNIQHLFTSAKHKNVNCAAHMHMMMEIVLVVDGRLNMTIDGIEYVIPKGCGVIVPSMEIHLFESKEQNVCNVIIFSKELVTYFVEFLKDYTPSTHMFTLSEASRFLTESILSGDENKTDYIHVQAMLASICSDIYEQCGFEERKTHVNDALEAAVEYMEGHFLEPLDLARVARAIGQHPVTLSKMFSEKAGLNFNFYLQYLRCSYAARLVKSQSITFAEAAYSAGFGSVRSFNRAFLNIYGLTPTQYKKGTLV